MKARFLNLRGLGRRLRAAILVATPVLLSSVAMGQSGSPVGTTWDCIISGARSGIAYLTFSSDTNGGTFDGYEILVPKRPSSLRQSLITGYLAGNGLGVQPQAQTQSTNIYGGFRANGPWGFDRQGRIIGYFAEVIDLKCATNAIPLSTNTFESATPVFETNVFSGGFCVTLPLLTNTLPGSIINQTICYQNVLTCTAFTNTVNFRGKVVSGKRLTLVGTTSLGNVTLRGVPAAPLSDISGEWYGVKRQNSISSIEFCDLTNLSSAQPASHSMARTLASAASDTSNAYLVSGNSVDCWYDGVALLSSQRKIAFAMDAFSGTNYMSTRAVIGPFNWKKFSANTGGIDSPGGTTGLTNRVSFQITKRLSMP